MTLRKQCKACPWKTSTDPAKDIPGGYSEQKHRDLRSTVAEPGAPVLRPTLHMMACHETPPGKERACIGWVMNQLGPGNNIALRLRAAADPVFGAEVAAMRLDGPQHERFEDTLPKSPRAKRRTR